MGKALYGLKDGTIEAPIRLVVPLGYGFTEAGLPDAARKTTFEAARIAEKFGAALAYCNVNYLGPGLEDKEDAAKKAIFKNFNLSRVIVADPCQNSVIEARNIKKAFQRTKIVTPSVIVVVCDWPHARSTRLIWNKVFLFSLIKVKSIEGEWDKTHLVPLQRSLPKWLVANILRHGALRILGTDWVAKKQYTQK